VNPIPEQTNNELDRRHKSTGLIIRAQILIAVVLTAVAWFITADNASNAVPSIVGILWIVILVIAIGAFLLRRVLFAPAVLRDTAVIKGVKGLFQSLQTKTILLAAMGEIIAVLGFVVSQLSGDKYDMLRAAGIALIIFFISFPSKSAWQRVAQAAAK